MVMSVAELEHWENVTPNASKTYNLDQWPVMSKGASHHMFLCSQVQ